MSSPKQLARIAGVFYLLVGIFGGFSEGFVDPKLHVAGNATATAANVVANSDLVRMGVVAHLVDGVFFALTAMALYLLLNHVQKNAARLMVLFVALAVGMICLNAVFLFEGMQVATDPSYVAAFGVAGSSALVMVLLDIQHYGTLAAQSSSASGLRRSVISPTDPGCFPRPSGSCWCWPPSLTWRTRSRRSCFPTSSYRSSHS